MESQIPANGMTIQQVACMLQVTERTIHRWITIGQLPAYRVGVRCVRIRQADVDKLQQRIPAPEIH
jgi:excisionase family DNA binding protein